MHIPARPSPPSRTRSTGWSLLLCLGAFACAGAPVTEEGNTDAAIEECTFDVPLEAGDIPCICAGVEVSSLPTDGSACTCDSVADLICI